MIGTYAELQAAVAGWLNRTDLTARIPEFIALAETGLRGRAETKHLVDGALSLSASETELASDVGSIQSLSIAQAGGPAVVYPTSFANLLNYRVTFGESGLPRYYAVTGDTLWLAPAPDATYDATLVYIEKLDIATTGTNWLLTNHPGAYLYATLIEAAPFIGDDERVSLWQSRLQGTLTSVAAERDRAFYGGPLVGKAAITLGG